MSASTLSITLPSFALVTNVNRRTKVIVVGLGVGVTLLGLLARYLRRRNRYQTWQEVRARQAGRAARKGKSIVSIKTPMTGSCSPDC